MCPRRKRKEKLLRPDRDGDGNIDEGHPLNVPYSLLVALINNRHDFFGVWKKQLGLHILNTRKTKKTKTEKSEWFKGRRPNEGTYPEAQTHQDLYINWPTSPVHAHSPIFPPLPLTILTLPCTSCVFLSPPWPSFHFKLSLRSENTTLSTMTMITARVSRQTPRPTNPL